MRQCNDPHNYTDPSSPHTPSLYQAMKITAPTNPHHLPTNLSSKWPQIEPQFLNFTSINTLFNTKNQSCPLFLTHCTTKPHANKKSTDETHSNSDSLPNPIVPLPFSTNDFSSASSLSRGLIFDVGPKNSWDGHEIGSPVVKRFVGDDDERWYMWYHGSSTDNPGSDSIGLAVSRNGVHWERGGQGVRSNADVGSVMSSSKDWWAFDTHSVRPGEVIMMSSNKVRANSGVYWLYYTGLCSDDTTLKSLPGLAMSQDGRHWARIEGDHHTGALLDVGPDGDWDSSFIASPQVVFHGPGDLRMYYHSFDVEKGHFAIGLARSRDGVKWVKLGKVLGPGPNGSFDEGGVASACVSRSKGEGRYLMVYEGVGVGGRRSVGMAVSSDGLKDWRRLGDGPVLERSDGGVWDCEGVGSPCLVEMDVGEWRLYYGGIGREGKSGIGLAVSKKTQGDGELSFERWTGFGLVL